jgi:hypothetical protein
MRCQLLYEKWPKFRALCRRERGLREPDFFRMPSPDDFTCTSLFLTIITQMTGFSQNPTRTRFFWVLGDFSRNENSTVVDKNLENTVWQCFWRLFNKVLTTIYAYLRHLESYYCILRWIKCIRGSFFRECRAPPVDCRRGRPAWAEPWFYNSSNRNCCTWWSLCFTFFCSPPNDNWLRTYWNTRILCW